MDFIQDLHWEGVSVIPWELRISSKPTNYVIFIYISKLLSNHAQEFLPSVLRHDKTSLSINITEGPEEDVFISQIVSSIQFVRMLFCWCCWATLKSEYLGGVCNFITNVKWLLKMKLLWCKLLKDALNMFDTIYQLLRWGIKLALFFKSETCTHWRKYFNCHICPKSMTYPILRF